MSAVAGPSTSTSSYLGRAADFVRPDFHQVNLDIEGYLKTERNLKLDEGESLFPVCHPSFLPFALLSSEDLPYSKRY